MRRPVAPVENLRPSRQRAKDMFIVALGQRLAASSVCGPVRDAISFATVRLPR
jgi:hypothetical protein